MEFPLDQISSVRLYSAAVHDSAMVEEGACSNAGASAEPDRSVMGIVEAIGALSENKGDGHGDSADIMVNNRQNRLDWTKRIRVGKASADRAPCPSRPSALEKSECGYAEKLGDNVINPCLGSTFDSLGEAYDFYNLYSWEHGFGIRYGKIRLNAQKTKCTQEIVCGCSVDIVGLGVSCYSSKDLWAWKNEGVVLRGEQKNVTHDLHKSVWQ